MGNEKRENERERKGSSTNFQLLVCRNAIERGTTVSPFKVTHTIEHGIRQGIDFFLRGTDMQRNQYGTFEDLSVTSLLLLLQLLSTGERVRFVG